MKKNIAVIGLGRFGLSLVEALSKQDVELVAVDEKLERVEKASQFTDYTVVCDSTNEEALREAGIQNMDHVVVAMGQAEDLNVSTTMITIIKLKKLGIPKITVRLDDETFVETMELIGATEVIFPLKIASERFANKISSNSIIDYFNMTDDFDAYEVGLSDTFKELPIIDLNSRTKYMINILLIKRDEKLIVPSRNDVLIANDSIFIFGRRKDVNKIVSFFEGHIVK